MAQAHTQDAILTIDLDGVAANYRNLAERMGQAQLASVVKADAYGLGVGPLATTLAAAGCQDFFVATLAEGAELRQILPQAPIHILNGLPAGAGDEFVGHRLIPVLNSLPEVKEWSRLRHADSRAGAADLQIDTGLNRLGLDSAEVARLAAGDGPDFALDCLLSHLACADLPDDPMNARQLAAFLEARALLPPTRASIAASSGIFLGPAFHLDLGRAGAALFGINPTPGRPNPMAQVIRFQARILQVRVVDSPQTVGYGAAHRVTRPTTVATVAAGYADGYARSLGSLGTAYIEDWKVPVLGRISMDLTGLDVTQVPENLARPGMYVDLIGERNPIDEVARQAGTIGYEILTGLRGRPHRQYVKSKKTR